MHTYIHTCIHTYIHTCMHAYIHTYIHVHTYTYIHIHIHTHTYTCIHMHTHTYIQYIHIHTHTYSCSSWHLGKFVSISIDLGFLFGSRIVALFFISNNHYVPMHFLKNQVVNFKEMILRVLPYLCTIVVVVNARLLQVGWAGHQQKTTKLTGS